MKKIFRRLITILPAILLQIAWLFVIINFLAPYSAAVNLILTALAVLLVIYVISKRDEGAYKNLWLLVILALPVPGAFLYLCFGNRKTARPLARRLSRAKASLPPLPETAPDIKTSLRQENPRMAETFEYVCASAGTFATRSTNAVYYPLGEDMWRDMLEALRQAKQYVFAEYFIVAEGVMWDTMVELLAQKVKEGVDVRFMYDDLGSLSTYSRENVEKLKKAGIRCTAFNPLLFVRGTLNNRDHRKMLVIDGKVAFSGGINLADEYINYTHRFGHWKDIGFRIEGESAACYAYMFCEFWNAFSGTKIPPERIAFSGFPSPSVSDGYAVSYYDSPIRRDALSNNVYVELLSQAVHTAWFFTPYLMLGDVLADAFIRAAKRGVDVRIIMPGIPDKKLVFRMSRSYYPMLVEAGVKIYEYTPGFVHAKACLIDDMAGTLGTVNLDYRSLYLHFENNTVFYQAPLLADLKKDFLETQSKCREIRPEDVKGNLPRRFMDSVLKIFAPLC